MIKSARGWIISKNAMSRAFGEKITLLFKADPKGTVKNRVKVDEMVSSSLMRHQSAIIGDVKSFN
jgi:hypothetical protein